MRSISTGDDRHRLKTAAESTVTALRTIAT
jgi:hypothetical protein